MTNSKLSPVNVYVPVHIKDATGIYSRSNRTPSDAPVFLKEQEGFLFTKEELLWLLQNTFNAGVKYQEDYFMYLERGVNFETPNQTEYIQSLF